MGINAHVISALETTGKIKVTCGLVFDKMSIRKYLHFNQTFSCIEGFEDLESHDRTRIIANHAPVFMLHGLCK
jgi:hypothetical protein